MTIPRTISYNIIFLTFFKSIVEQVFSSSFEHLLKVSTSIIRSAKVFDTTHPKLAIVDNIVMYVPPKRESLIREKNPNVKMYIVYAKI